MAYDHKRHANVEISGDQFLDDVAVVGVDPSDLAAIVMSLECA